MGRKRQFVSSEVVRGGVVRRRRTHPWQPPGLLRLRPVREPTEPTGPSGASWWRPRPASPFAPFSPPETEAPQLAQRSSRVRSDHGYGRSTVLAPAPAVTAWCAASSSQVVGDRAQPPRLVWCPLRPRTPGSRGSGTRSACAPREAQRCREPPFQFPAKLRGVRRSDRQRRGMPTPGQVAELPTRGRPLGTRPMPPARRRPGGSPVRQRPADTVTDLAPLLTMCFAGESVARSSLELFGPRLLNGRRVLQARSLKADQELGDQVGTLLLGERKCLAKQRLRVIRHTPSVPLRHDRQALDPQDNRPSRATTGAPVHEHAMCAWVADAARTSSRMSRGPMGRSAGDRFA